MKNNEDSLLVAIQKALLDGDSKVAPILLSVRYLAKRLGSDILEQWVRYEAEGYPKDFAVPDYRTIEISYKGFFTGPWGRTLKNAPIPITLIEQLVGKHATTMPVHQSIAEIDELVERSKSKESGRLAVPGANELIPYLHDKVYPEFACNEVIGEVSASSVAAVQSTVRSRLMDLTLELEKISGASNIKLGPNDKAASTGQADNVNNITNQTIYGNNYNVSTKGGAFTSHSINIPAGDKTALRAALIEHGLDENSASELTEIITQDNVSKAEPLGSKTKAWIQKNVSRVATNLFSNMIVEFAQRFHGIG